MDSNATYPGVIPPPPGVSPNVENPYASRQRLTLAIVVACLSLVTCFFFIRAYVKLRIMRVILLEDVSCALAWVFILVFGSCMVIMARFGLGLHAWELPPESHINLVKWTYICTLFYCPAAFFTKVTLLLLVARIFAVRRGASTAIYIIINLLLISYLIIEILKIIVCLPIRAYWDPSIHGKCINQPAVFVTDTTVAIITDIVILLAPIPLTWSMRLPLVKKFKIMSIMSVGGIAVGLTIWRLVLVIQYLHATDSSWAFGMIVITTITELTLGVICSCFPALNLLIRRGKKASSYLHHSTQSTDRCLLSRGLEGTTVWRSTKSTGTTTDPPDSEPPLTNIDAQLARLARPDAVVVHDGLLEAGMRGEEEDLMQYIQGRNSVSSATGRREGWLAQAGHAPDANLDGERGTVDISLELSKITGNRVWDRIWDGQSHTDGSRAPSAASSVVDGDEP